jgi:hypothetical protein
MMHRVTLRRTAVAVAAAGTASAFAAPAALAQGADDTVRLSSAGDTRVTVSESTGQALRNAGIQVAPLRPASVRGGAVRFAITGGEIDPKTAAGLINHSGGLRFSKGSRRVNLRNFRIRGANLSAAVGRTRVNILSLDLRNARITRPTFGGPLRIGTRVSNVVLRLNGTAATALNRGLHTRAFKSGLRLATAVVNARPSEIILESGNTALTLDAATAGVLTNTLGLSLGVVAPAAANPSGAIEFPITQSKIRTSLTRGTIAHTGGISLSRPGTSLSLTNFDIKLGANPALAASVNGGSAKADILTLDLSDAQIRSRGLTATVSGAVAKVNKTTSDALTATFGAPATEGATLGTAAVTANVR